MEKIIVKSSKRFNGSTVIAAVDVGSAKNMGYCRARGYETKPFEFENNQAGFEMFWDRVEGFKRMHNLEDVVVGIESTGCYGVPFLRYFKDRGVNLVQVNPVHTKRLKALNGNSPNKTDKKDPKVIADIMELGNHLTVCLPEGIPAELRAVTHARERLVERFNELRNHLHALEFQIFPEFGRLLNLDTKTARYLLKKAPRPEDVVAYGQARLKKTVKKISRGHLDEEKAVLLYEAAKKSVGIREGVAGICEEIGMILFEMDQIERYIIEKELKLAELLENVPESKYLLSMRGVGNIIVAGLIGEIGDFRKFGTETDLLKYAGLNIYEISSGKHKGQRRISKVGRPLIRKLLYFAALNTVREDGIMHKTYASYRDRGIIKTKALVAVMRKLLRIMFTIVCNNSFYCENYNVIATAA